MYLSLELHAPSAQSINPVVCGCRETTLSAAGGRGAPSGWSQTGALMSSTHLGRLLSGHRHCSVAVYLLFSVARADFLQRMRRFTSSVCVPLGVHASFGNA